jgi:hypothetical protein
MSICPNLYEIMCIYEAKNNEKLQQLFKTTVLMHLN